MRQTIAVLLLAGCVMAPALAQKAAPKIVCWNDEKGHRACGDRVPPQYAKGERKLVDAQGRVVETRPREPTAAEVAEREKREAEVLAEQKRASEQAAYDGFLLQSYTGVADLQRARKDRLDTLNGRIALSEKASADAKTTLVDLRKRAAENDKNIVVKKQLREYEKSAGDNDKALESMRAERKTVCTHFERDIHRFEQLKNLPASAPMECPGAIPDKKS
jgi:hypothetical protein